MTAAETLRAAGPAPRLGIVLGSGLGGLTDALEEPVAVPYAALEGFPAAGVAGHRGQVVLGRLAGLPVACLAGRKHVYEGDATAMRVRPAATSAPIADASAHCPCG